MDVVRSLTTERLHPVQWTERSAEPTSVQDLRMLLRAIARQVVETMVQPEYLAIFRLMLAELPRFPELGPLFRQTVPEPAISDPRSFISVCLMAPSFAKAHPRSFSLPLAG